MPALDDDHHRPRFHVRPPSGYVNDPNGPLVHHGTFHLYFQHVLDTARVGPVHWGHATSTDLVTWTLHPHALTPAPGTPDEGGCWSGNTVAVDGRVYAFYSAFTRGDRFQPVRRVESEDGFTFAHSTAMVGPPGADEAPVQFRDPFVWRHHGRWCMVVGAGVGGDLAQARLYESADLSDWSYVGPFASRVRTDHGTAYDTGIMWECPQYAPLGKWGVLLVGAWHPDEVIMRVLALSGRDSANELVEPGPARQADHGPNFYAPSVLQDPTGRVLVWGWATEGRDADATVEADWSGMLTLPRVLTVTETGEPRWHPPAELVGLRSERLDHVEGPLSRLHAIDGVPAQFELELDLTVPSEEHPPTAVRLVTAGGDSDAAPSERLVLRIDWRDRTVSLDRNAASRDVRAHRGSFTLDDAVVPTGDAGARRVQLRLLVDGSVGELFSGTGQVLTSRFYPSGAPPWTLQLDPGGEAHGEVTVWRLRAAVS
jgi:beta-fructofuranosidase